VKRRPKATNLPPPMAKSARKGESRQSTRAGAAASQPARSAPLLRRGAALGVILRRHDERIDVRRLLLKILDVAFSHVAAAPSSRAREL
jgi:hypothetical protein